MSQQQQADEHETDYSDPSGDDALSLARDRIPVRSMAAADLPALIRIDRKLTGRDRTQYFERKLAEALEESGVRVSLVAELDGLPAGFVMARVDYGEFGQAEPEAVIDTIGVDPGHLHERVAEALMSQLLANLAGLRVERVRTQVAWNAYDLLGFLEYCGFRPSQRLSLSRKVG